MKLAMRSPECGSPISESVTGLNADELRIVRETAVSAARAYLTCDRPALASLSDEARLQNHCFLPNDDSRVDGLNICRLSGNSNLVFASLTSSFAAARRKPLPYKHVIEGTALEQLHSTRWLPAVDLGHQSLFAILCRGSSGWKVLSITDDPVSVKLGISEQLGRFSARLGNEADQPEVTPAQLITAEGEYPLRAVGTRFGDFIWRPSASANVIGQIAEFTALSGERNLTRLVLLNETAGKLSSGVLMTGGQSTWRWRVWSISSSGAVTFSEQRSFKP